MSFTNDFKKKYFILEYQQKDYFEWYRMIDIECIRVAKIKLVSTPRKYWQHIRRSLEHRQEPPITQW